MGKGAVVQYPVASTCARGLGQRTRKTGHKNQTWHPELRIETRDPDRIWIVCFIHDTGFDHNGGVSKTPNITSFWVQRFGVPAMSTACLGTIVEPWRHCCPPVARQTKTVHLQYQPSGCILQVTWLLLFFATDHCVVFRYVLYVVQQWHPVQRSRLSMSVGCMYAIYIYIYMMSVLHIGEGHPQRKNRCFACGLIQ